MKTQFAIALSTCLFLLIGISAAGDPAITDLAKVDDAYAFIGEYTGTDAGSPVGVRISVRDGKIPMFARLYRGGLPGRGWDLKDPEHFEGDLVGGSLKLKSEATERLIRSAKSGLVLVSGKGEPAELTKVARRSVTLGKPAPAGAKVLFDGKKNDHWKNMKVTDDGLLGVGCETVEPLTGGYLHVEFRTPYMRKSDGQKRGNSGLYLQRRYEVQVLESFALRGIENECGALYRQRRPDLNMALPPLVWQSYDIFFEPARFSPEGKKIKPTVLTVVHNGVPVHHRVSLVNKTGAGKEEGPDPLPLLLQDHGDPVFYRNLWFVPASAVPVAKGTADRLTALFGDQADSSSFFK